MTAQPAFEPPPSNPARTATRSGMRPVAATQQRTGQPSQPSPAGQLCRGPRGLILYVGLDEATARAHGTSLTQVAQTLQRSLAQLVPEAQAQAVVALAPKGFATDLEAVRAVASGVSNSSGPGLQGPVRQRIPSRLSPPGKHRRALITDENEIHIDLPRREVRTTEGTLGLSAKEFDLLTVLVNSAGRTLSRDDIMSTLWGEDDELPDSRTIDVHVRRLRRRLGAHSTIVRTIRGSGYRFDEHPDVRVWPVRSQL